MNNEIPVLFCKLKKYERTSKKKSANGKSQISRRYMIPIKKDQIEGSAFENVEDIVILTNDDFKYEIEKYRDSTSIIKELEDSLKKSNDNFQQFEKTKNELEKIQTEYAAVEKDLYDASEELKLKNIEIIGVKNEYNVIFKENSDLKRELKRLTDLRNLEKESLRLKANEVEITKDEYDELRKSHELLWNVVHKKDKEIKNLEDKGFMNNLRKKMLNK